MHCGCDVESSAADVQQLCEKCAHCFTDGLVAFQSIDDVINMAMLQSNHGKLMRLHAQSAASRLTGAQKREFTTAERNYFLQVTAFAYVYFFVVITITTNYYYATIPVRDSIVNRCRPFVHFEHIIPGRKVAETSY